MRHERLNGGAARSVAPARLERAAAIEPAVVDASGAAQMLNLKSAQSFYSMKRRLEKNGFPKKLPGINGWSKACIRRWIDTNGETYMPAEQPEIVNVTGEPITFPTGSLEEAYGR